MEETMFGFFALNNLFMFLDHYHTDLLKSEAILKSAHGRPASSVYPVHHDGPFAPTTKSP